MKNLYSKIQDTYINELFNDINTTLILEALNCTVLREVSKQLKDLKNQEQDENKNSRLGSSYTNTKQFKNLFAGNGIAVRWDQISDSDVETYDLTSMTEKETKKVEKEVRKVIQSKRKAIIIVYNPIEKIYEYAFCNWGEVYRLKIGASSRNYAGSREGYRTNGGTWRDLPVKEKMDLITNKVLYFIDVTDKMQEEYYSLKGKRNEEKRGMVLLDPASLKRMAEENFNRYKEIVAKNKANRLNNTALLGEVETIIHKVTTLAAQVAKAPIDNADLITPINNMCAYIYDVRRYVTSSNRRNPGYYSGVDGLLPLMAKYTKLLKDLQSSGGYDYQRKEFDQTQKQLKESIEKIKKIAEGAGIDLGLAEKTPDE